MSLDWNLKLFLHFNSEKTELGLFCVRFSPYENVCVSGKHKCPTDFLLCFFICLVLWTVFKRNSFKPHNKYLPPFSFPRWGLADARPSTPNLCFCCCFHCPSATVETNPKAKAKCYYPAESIIKLQVFPGSGIIYYHTQSGCFCLCFFVL